jgi:hypothetical protein
VAKEKRGRMPSIEEDREAIFEGMRAFLRQM